METYNIISEWNLAGLLIAVSIWAILFRLVKKSAESHGGDRKDAVDNDKKTTLLKILAITIIAGLLYAYSDVLKGTKVISW